MSAAIDNTGGVWECGHCGYPTTETHFYRDRATGTMKHARDYEERQEQAARCGWRFDDSYGTFEQCRLHHGHFGNHLGYSVHWSDDSRFGAGAIPPASVSDGQLEGADVAHGPETAVPDDVS